MIAWHRRGNREGVGQGGVMRGIWKVWTRERWCKGDGEIGTAQNAASGWKLQATEDQARERETAQTREGWRGKRNLAGRRRMVQR